MWGIAFWIWLVRCIPSRYASGHIGTDVDLVLRAIPEKMVSADPKPVLQGNTAMKAMLAVYFGLEGVCYAL